MTPHDLILYAHNRLEKEWYETPKCDQIRQAFEHFKEETSNVILDCIIQAYVERICRILTKGSAENDNTH